MTYRGRPIPSWTRLSVKSPAKLQLDLGASRALAAVLVAVHVGAAAIAALSPLALSLRVAILVLVAAGLYRGLGRHALRRGRHAITGFVLNDDDTCAVRHGAGDWEDARLLDRWVHPRLTILVVRGARRRRASGIVVPWDAVPAEAFRRLRVRLRLQTAAA